MRIGSEICLAFDGEYSVICVNVVNNFTGVTIGASKVILGRDCYLGIGGNKVLSDPLDGGRKFSVETVSPGSWFKEEDQLAKQVIMYGRNSFVDMNWFKLQPVTNLTKLDQY